VKTEYTIARNESGGRMINDEDFYTIRVYGITAGNIVNLIST
jgi:hypothetical protein